MPPLSWNEIRSRALDFSGEWASESSEDAESKSFWDGFFHIFGVSRHRIASFERRVKKIDGKDGYIDLLWKGVMLVEHKSRGKNLDRAYEQALDYFPGLKDAELPRYLLVSDFAQFRLYDLDENTQHEFKLKDLHKNINLFGFIAGYKTHAFEEQDPVNIKAAEKMGKLHDQMKEVGYKGHPLEVYLVRLLFCMFAEDTGIFDNLRQFQDYIENKTGEDGSDLGNCLEGLFQTLNTPAKNRLENLDEDLAAFPYVNGELFEEILPHAAFDSKMRQALLDCCSLDWSKISPAIFGSLFQSIMDEEARRNLGAHYTSEQNILKLINPLFMDDLRAEFQKVKNNKNKLFEFHKKLRTLKFLDPACGCGNFLVIAYRELRLLEMEVLKIARKNNQLSIYEFISLDVDQFYGIELEEFPAQIAQVALWLMDHQMNQKVSENFGKWFSRIPLKTSAKIVNGNALQMDWNDVVPAERLSFIMGNPPFVGKNFQNAEQKQEMKTIYGETKYGASLDYVTAWYKKSLQYITNKTDIKCAFVSTNSITVGEQVYMLWPGLLEDGICIHFAHRTFAWSNEATGKAAVHCVIIGFGLNETAKKRLFDYEDIQGEPHEISAANINPYLVDADNAIIPARTSALCDCPKMVNGSKPADGGNLSLTESEKNELLKLEPNAAEWIKPYSMGEEFINGIPRFCLWLKHCPPEKLRKMPYVLKRVEAVRKMRSKSAKKNTREFAEQPTIFTEDRQGEGAYLAIPQVSSERRVYIPVGYLPPDHIAGNMLYAVQSESLYDFGIITSLMHNAWMRTVCGRLESRYRYSARTVYNNFIWPLKPTAKQKQTIEQKAQTVLDARAKFPDSTLADLYDPLTMPPELVKAHQTLDKAVDSAYGRKKFKTEAERVAFLFDLYQQYTDLFKEPKKSKKKSK
ncbi:DNA methyltransferase [Candidatus Mycalebacterium sp.]